MQVPEVEVIAYLKKAAVGIKGPCPPASGRLIAGPVGIQHEALIFRFQHNNLVIRSLRFLTGLQRNGQRKVVCRHSLLDPAVQRFCILNAAGTDTQPAFHIRIPRMTVPGYGHLARFPFDDRDPHMTVMDGLRRQIRAAGDPAVIFIITVDLFNDFVQIIQRDFFADIRSNHFIPFFRRQDL